MATRLTIVGAGLIGSSFALALRKQFDIISAVEPDPAHASAALADGIIDAIVDTVGDDQDAVLLSCPSDLIADWLVRLAQHPGTIFDAGSVKAWLLAEVTARLGAVPAQFVPCHPIAGSERSGPQAADSTLFLDRQVIITPAPTTDPQRLRQVADWWRLTGAQVTEMEAVEHDSIYALTSHLPHLLAFTYLQAIGPEHLPHTGGGFRDFSRIGASDPDMWSAIFTCNRQALLPLIDDFQRQLTDFRAAIERNDTAECVRLIRAARNHRAALDVDLPRQGSRPVESGADD